MFDSMIPEEMTFMCFFEKVIKGEFKLSVLNNFSTWVNKAARHDPAFKTPKSEAKKRKRKSTTPDEEKDEDKDENDEKDEPAIKKTKAPATSKKPSDRKKKDKDDSESQIMEEFNRAYKDLENGLDQNNQDVSTKFNDEQIQNMLPELFVMGGIKVSLNKKIIREKYNEHRNQQLYKGRSQSTAPVSSLPTHVAAFFDDTNERHGSLVVLEEEDDEETESEHEQFPLERRLEEIRTKVCILLWSSFVSYSQTKDYMHCLLRLLVTHNRTTMLCFALE